MNKYEQKPDHILDLHGHTTAEAGEVLVDDATAPTAWRFVEEFYRVRDTTVGYEVGEGVNLFADEDAAIAAAESLDGADFDCEVRAFTKPTGDSGRVVWGA
jgi:hypothetical protein